MSDYLSLDFMDKGKDLLNKEDRHSKQKNVVLKIIINSRNTKNCIYTVITMQRVISEITVQAEKACWGAILAVPFGLNYISFNLTEGSKSLRP